MGLREWQTRRRKKKAKEREEMLKRIQAGEAPRSLDEVGLSLLYSKVAQPRVVTCPQGVVSYTIGTARMGNALGHIVSADAIDEKIRQILAVTPDLSLGKLRRLGQDMGISIRTFEKGKPSGPPPEEDVIF